MALAITINLSLLGRVGFEGLAQLCLQKASYLKNQIEELEGWEVAFSGPTFNEFAIRKLGGGLDETLSRARQAGVLVGVPLGPDEPEFDDCLLVAVTERHRRADLDRLVELLDG